MTTEFWPKMSSDLDSYRQNTLRWKNEGAKQVLLNQDFWIILTKGY